MFKYAVTMLFLALATVNVSTADAASHCKAQHYTTTRFVGQTIYITEHTRKVCTNMSKRRGER